MMVQYCCDSGSTINIYIYVYINIYTVYAEQTWSSDNGQLSSHRWQRLLSVEDGKATDNNNLSIFENNSR